MSHRPPWVISQLAQILGFVTEAILPELESQHNQVRLQSHLQDFLGPSPESRNFINRYIALRFPPTPTSIPAPPVLLKSSVFSSTVTNSRPRSPFPASDLAASVNDAFGTNGTVYTKVNDTGSRSSKPSSGSSTPQHRRQAGAVTIVEARPDKGKGKAKSKSSGDGPGFVGNRDKIWDLPKSKEVIRLEGVKDKLSSIQDGGKFARENDASDCFCQAYTPHCPHCGLILCSVHPAFRPCPSCANPLYSPAQLARLIHRITLEIEAQLALEQSAREAEERDRQARLIAESGGGAFPTLPGALTAKQAPAGRKVLTIGKNGTKLITTSFKTPTIVSRTVTPPPTDIVARPRSPPLDQGRVEKEWQKTSLWRTTEGRPWGNKQADKKGEGWGYVELPLSLWVEEDFVGRRKAAKKKRKDGLGEGGRIVPGAVGLEA